MQRLGSASMQGFYQGPLAQADEEPVLCRADQAYESMSRASRTMVMPGNTRSTEGMIKVQSA